MDGLIVSVAATRLETPLRGRPRWRSPSDTVLLACWAAYSACREALANVTYERHYYRERRREAWGARSLLARPLLDGGRASWCIVMITTD